MDTAILLKIKNEVYQLFLKHKLLNLWDDFALRIQSDLKIILNTDLKFMIDNFKKINKKHNITILSNDMRIHNSCWVIPILDSELLLKFQIKIKFKIWNYSVEKAHKYLLLQKKFKYNLIKFQSIKKCILASSLRKVLIFPIRNPANPLFQISNLIQKIILNINISNFITPIEVLSNFRICDSKYLREFYSFLNISETRFLTKLKDEILPFIINIQLFINKTSSIKKVYYSDSPDFIIENQRNTAFGVEITNIRKKYNYYYDRCNKEKLLRKLINSKCYYSKRYITFLKKSNFAYRQNINNFNKKLETRKSLLRHFDNNKKYNSVIRENGLKVKRGNKIFYILNSWNNKITQNEKRLIKNIAIKKNIPSKKLFFFTINTIK